MSDSVYYFSNGTEGDIWMREHCNRCLHDHGTHQPEWGAEDGCAHILSMMAGTANQVFIRVPHATAQFDVLECTEFTRCPCDRGPDDPGVPEKRPIDPNQGALFDTDGLMPGVWRDIVLDELTPAEAP